MNYLVNHQSIHIEAVTVDREVTANHLAYAVVYVFSSRNRMSDYVNVTELFGCDVFNDSVMEERLPKKVYKELKKTIISIFESSDFWKKQGSIFRGKQGRSCIRQKIWEM